MNVLTASNLTSDWFSVRDGKSTIYISGGDDWDDGSVQLEFRKPWNDTESITDERYIYTADTVDVIEVGDGAQVRFVISGGGGSESVEVHATS